MSLPDPEPGLVIRYAYLWRSDQRRGQDEGSKDRPRVIVLSVRNSTDGRQVVVVAPITHIPPQLSDDAIEIPLATKQRLGLDESRSWVMVDEVNRFYWPGFDVRPVPRRQPPQYAYGFLPPSFFRQVKARLTAAVKARRITVVPRME